MHSVRFLFLPMVLSLLLSGCAQTRETSSTIFAMNTVMELTAYGDSGQQVLDQATERIYQLEHLLSVTDENSDISAINHGEGAWVPVSQETFQLLSLALSYGRETQGALDITAYSAVHAWGFTTGEYRVPGPEELAELAARIDYTQVELDPEGCRVRLPQGMQLDLGSIAKGWASDLLAELAGGEPAIFNLGGNVRTAGDKPDGSPWRIGIQTPEAGSSGYLGVLELTGSQAVITSGGYERYFEEDGQTYWHIMDPETAAPARSGLRASPSSLLWGCTATLSPPPCSSGGQTGGPIFGGPIRTLRWCWCWRTVPCGSLPVWLVPSRWQRTIRTWR